MPETLSPGAVASIIFACTFAAALFGMVLHLKLPDHHLNDESREVEKLVMGLIATLAALVLGLLIASAKSSLDRQSAELRQVSATVLELDGLLAHFGPAASDARQKLHSAVATAAKKIWLDDNGQLSSTGDQGGASTVFDSIQNLLPNTEARRFIKKKALEISIDLRQTRALMIERVGSSIPWPFLMVLVFWLSVLFLGFGLFASVNATVLVALLIGAVSVSSGIFLILELDQPYAGLIRVSDAPLRHALAELDQ